MTINPQKHAAAMIDSLGHDEALRLAGAHVEIGDGVTYGVNYWRLVVAAIKRDFACALTDRGK